MKFTWVKIINKHSKDLKTSPPNTGTIQLLEKNKGQTYNGRING
jgi:hypothetical protein